MNSASRPPNLVNFARWQITLTLVVLAAVFVAAGLLSKAFEQETLGFLNGVAATFGFTGLSLVVFLGDFFVSPIPPDIVLFVVAKSEWQHDWPFYVSITAVVSFCAGHAGWFMGRLLRRRSWAPKQLREWALSQKYMIRKYGVWAVILGALTPLPFSFTCWSAGFLGLRYHRFFLGTLFRFPRIYLYYFAIYYSNDVFGYLF